MAREVEVRRNGEVVGHARVCGQDDIFPPHALPARRDDYGEEGSMDKDKHKTALDALSELIRGELEGDDRARFSRVGRLALIGQKLMVEMNPRAEDADEDIDGDEYGQLGGFYPPRRRRRHGGELMLGAGNDQQQMVRETLALLGPAMGGVQQQTDARRRESMARELNQLLDAREVLKEQDTAAAVLLTKRIDAILAAMGEEEKPKGDEDGLSVVPAVDVRRHQAEPGFGRLNADDSQWPVADGEGRGAGALGEGVEPGRAPQVVGHGG